MTRPCPSTLSEAGFLLSVKRMTPLGTISLFFEKSLAAVFAAQSDLPAAVWWGAAIGILFSGMMVWVAAWLRKKVLLPGVGHGSAEERPDQVNELFLDFLGQMES